MERPRAAREKIGFGGRSRYSKISLFAKDVPVDLNEMYSSALQEGNRREQELFHKLAVRFRTLAERRIREKEDCEEVVQEALAVVWRKFKSVTIKTSFAAWARQVLMNEIYRYYRDNGTLKRHIESVDDIDLFCTNQTIDYTMRDLLRICLENLLRANKRYARVLLLKYEGYDHREICKDMGISYGNLCVILSRARSLLKDCLDKGGEE